MSRSSRSARSGTPVAAPICRMVENTLSSVPRSTIDVLILSLSSCAATLFGPVCTNTRSGSSLAITSASGSRNVPTRAMRATAGGNRQYVDTPTMRSPSPSANSVSVMLGDVDTIRAGIPDGWAAGAVATPMVSRTRAARRKDHQAREKRLPVLPVASRSDPLTPASCSILRPNSHRRSDRRFM
jgi:hypothetical protein